MKILVITGSRSIWNQNVIYKILNKYADKGFTHLMNGTAGGVDRIAKQWAVSNNMIPMDRPAAWSKHGAAAGPIRNKSMVDEAHKKSNGNCELCAIWDGSSHGTKGTYDYWMENYPTSDAELHIETPQPDWGKRGF